MKYFIIILLLITSVNLKGQSHLKQCLINALVELGEINEYESSKFYNQKLDSLNSLMVEFISFNNVDELLSLNNLSDTISIFVTCKKSENHDFELLSIRSNSYNWNYIIKNREILFRNEKSFDYFYEVHNLNDTEYLLIKRMDEMSYSCFEAYIGFTDTKKKNAKVLSVCSWTNVETRSIGVNNSSSKKQEIQYGRATISPIKINYNYEAKTISYGFNKISDGKYILRKAKYKNKNFKIKNYDQRTFEE